MTIPIRTLPEDLDAICAYLVKKPTGATVADARKVIDARFLDGRKISAFKFWGVIDDSSGTMKLTPEGRAYASGDAEKQKGVLSDIIKRVGPYRAVIERAFHRHEESISATDVAAHWHEHFSQK
jgi:hypothetical protein